MAVVVARYGRSATSAKETVRYIQHRRGREAGRTMTRRLFGLEGTMSRQEAYRLIDAASQQGRPLYYHLKVSPDPKQEDTAHQDLALEDVTRATMRALSGQRGPVVWMAAIHADHTAIRHMHVLAIVPRPLNRDELKAARDGATQECLMQRQELDLARQRQRAREVEEELQWEQSLC
jgi:hypothetical protein